MGVVSQPLARPNAPTDTLAYQIRVVRVLAAADFKLKYADSALGYVWSLAKPLALFTILYLVFGLGLRFGGTLDHYPLYLIIGVVLFNFFAEATTAAMTSLVARETILRRLPFPRLVVPVSTIAAAALTFIVSLLAVAVFVAGNRITPRVEWLLLFPLLAELLFFVLGLSLVLATVFVRFRDVRQLWELALRMLFYASPIIYPLQLLPGWAERLVLVNPFAQVIQDVRVVVLGEDGIVTFESAFGSATARLIPLAIVALILASGLAVFRREEPRFAERI
jgi:ABC-2 type transport system permease protein